ncbi:MAG: hypothetical protein M5U34_42335 [Chloroflexi bacterium]|nr:hypothetical protein [Chloroflexota bacterium]
MAIWTGQRGNLQLQGCNDDSNGGLQSQAATWAFAGTTYYIEVLSYSDGGNGSLTLKVSADAPNHIYLPLITR